MKRQVFTLCIAATAGAAVLSSLPASAQTNSHGYTIYTQNYDGTTQTPTGTTNGPGRAAVTVGSSVNLRLPGGPNYNYVAGTQSAAATVKTAGTTQAVGTAATGTTTFTNLANSGSQALNFFWQYTPTTTGPGLERFTTSGSINQRPIVDLASVVSFNMFVASSVPNAQINTTLEIEDNNDTFYNADTAGNTITTISATAPAPADVLGMRGSDANDTEVFIVGGAGNTKSGGYAADGKPVYGGYWQTVTFDLQADPHNILLIGTAGYTYKTSGLGSIYGMDFVPVNPVDGQTYSIYIDDLTIGGVAVTPTPEPSQWAAMGLGAAGLLGLGLRARRRNANLTAV